MFSRGIQLALLMVTCSLFAVSTSAMAAQSGDSGLITAMTSGTTHAVSGDSGL